MNDGMGKKPLLRNILGRFGGFCPEGACVPESGFVNHDSLVSRISLFQGVSTGRHCGVPT
jgi:hypothetical protein